MAKIKGKRRPDPARQGIDPAYIGHNLKRAREGLGLSQGAVATALGVVQPNVSAWETGAKAPILAHLRAMAVLYQTSLDLLLGVQEVKLRYQPGMSLDGVGPGAVEWRRAKKSSAVERRTAASSAPSVHTERPRPKASGSA